MLLQRLRSGMRTWLATLLSQLQPYLCTPQLPAGQLLCMLRGLTDAQLQPSSAWMQALYAALPASPPAPAAEAETGFWGMGHADVQQLLQLIHRLTEAGADPPPAALSQVISPAMLLLAPLSAGSLACTTDHLANLASS
jgi:hypothetical protein